MSELFSHPLKVEATSSPSTAPFVEYPIFSEHFDPDVPTQPASATPAEPLPLRVQ